MTVTFRGHKLGQTDHKGHRDILGHEVGHGETLMTLYLFGS